LYLQNNSPEQKTLFVLEGVFILEKCLCEYSSRMNTATPNTPKDGENIALLGIFANITLATVKFLG